MLAVAVSALGSVPHQNLGVLIPITAWYWYQ